MNEQLTPDQVKTLLIVHRAPSDGVDETETQWNFGQVTISKNEARFRVSYWDQLQSGARFFTAPFEGGPAGRGIAAIFETSDRVAGNPERSEYPVGWVPVDRKGEIEGWVATLNTEIAKLIAGSPPRGTGTPIDIGMYMEFGYDDDEPGVRSLRDVRRVKRPDHKADVVSYLRNAKTTAYTMGIEPDVFDPTKLAGQLSGKTDGAYRWPELLAYYVEHYDIALPDDFEQHMRKNGWRLPELLDSGRR